MCNSKTFKFTTSLSTSVNYYVIALIIFIYFFMLYMDFL